MLHLLFVEWCSKPSEEFLTYIKAASSGMVEETRIPKENYRTNCLTL